MTRDNSVPPLRVACVPVWPFKPTSEDQLTAGGVRSLQAVAGAAWRTGVSSSERVTVDGGVLAMQAAVDVARGRR